MLLCIVFVPQIIKVSGKNMLFDMPDNERKFHTNIVPQLGGTGIFFAYMIPFCMLLPPNQFQQWNNIIAAFLMLFITGLIDDLRSLNATKKFAAQFLPAIITVCIADVRLHSLHGFLGIGELPYIISIIISVTGCIFITNAFNFIDGVDGLATTLGLISCLALGMLFAGSYNIAAAILSFSLAGALAGFLRYNLPEAKIFMGDTGSLPIGYTISVLCIVLINSITDVNNGPVHSPKSAMIIALGILFIIIADSFRVIIARLRKGVSPFRGDRNHIHHYLLDSGFSQKNTIIILGAAELLLILLSFLLQDLNINLIFIILLTLFFSGVFFVHLRRSKKKSL